MLWGTLGYGTGDLTLTVKGPRRRAGHEDRSHGGGGRARHTGVQWTLRPDVAFGVEGTRSEPANNDAPEHGLAFRATLRW